jgi:hypothetical protein
MRDLCKCLERLAANVAGRRIGRNERRKSCLQIEQLAIDLIVFTVGDRGRRLFVIAAIMFFNFPPQARDAFRRRGFRFGHTL